MLTIGNNRECNGIPSSIIKENNYVVLLIDPLLHIVDLSIRKGEFPSALKITKIILIFKSGFESHMSY